MFDFPVFICFFIFSLVSVKILIRLANDIKSLDDKKYLILQEKLQEIGKMIGG